MIRRYQCLRLTVSKVTSSHIWTALAFVCFLNPLLVFEPGNKHFDAPRFEGTDVLHLLHHRFLTRQDAYSIEEVLRVHDRTRYVSSDDTRRPNDKDVLSAVTPGHSWPTDGLGMHLPYCLRGGLKRVSRTDTGTPEQPKGTVSTNLDCRLSEELPIMVR